MSTRLQDIPTVPTFRTVGTTKSAQVVSLFDTPRPQRETGETAVVSPLERLPHVVERICLLWGEPEFDGYVHSLVMDSRDGKRQGLPWDAAQELLFLSELSLAKRAIRESEKTGVPFETILGKLTDAAREAPVFGFGTTAAERCSIGRTNDKSTRDRSVRRDLKLW